MYNILLKYELMYAKILVTYLMQALVGTCREFRIQKTDSGITIMGTFGESDFTNTINSKPAHISIIERISI